MQSALVTIEKVLGRSVVTESRGQGPLKLLTPKNHGDGAWVYQSSLGGGFVREDAVSLEVKLAPEALCFLSSQAAGKVYRQTNSSFTLDATLAAGSTLITWPDPLLPFAGSRFTQRQTYRLHPTASLMLVDPIGAGRVATGERWAMDELVLSARVERSGEVLLNDAVRLDATHGLLAARAGPYDAFATIVIAGPRFEETIVRLDDELRASPLERAPATLITATRRPWGLIVRLAASSTAELHRSLQRLLGTSVVAVLGEDPWLRKW